MIDAKVDLAVQFNSNVNRRSFLRNGLAAAGSLVVAPWLLEACANQSAPTSSGGTVTVGTLLDGTGPLSLYGEPMVKAQTFAVEEINKKGGLLGKKIRLNYIDTQSDIAKYTAGAQELANDDSVVVVMGGITSASREAIRPVFDQYKKLYFYNQLYEGGVCDKWVFCTGIVPTQQMEVLIPYVLEKFGPRTYTVAADYNYGHIAAGWVRKYLKDKGGQLAGEEFFPLDVSNFATSISKIQSAAPNVVMSLLVGNDHLSFYRQFAALGLNRKIQIASTVVGLGNEQRVLDPKEGQGIIVAMPYFQELDTPASKKFVADFQARFPGTYINDEVNTVYSGFSFWAKAVEKAGSFDRDKVIKALESGLSFDAPEGTIKMQPGSHHATHNVHLAQVNANRGFDILKSVPNVAPAFEESVCNLVKDPNVHKQFEAPL